MTTFTLSITLGNDAMQTGEDAAYALRKVAERLEDVNAYLGEWNALTPHGQDAHTDVPIFDDNGNRVGRWAVSEPESAEAIAERLAADWSNDGETLDVDYRLALAAVRIARGEA